MKVVSRGGAAHRRRTVREDDVNDEEGDRSVCNFATGVGAHMGVSTADKLQGGVEFGD